VFQANPNSGRRAGLQVSNHGGSVLPSGLFYRTPRFCMQSCGGVCREQSGARGRGCRPHRFQNERLGIFRTNASEYFGGHRVDGAGAWSGGLGGIFSAGCIADSFAGASWAIGISSGSGISSRLSCSDRDFCRRSSSCWARAKERSRRTCACQIRSRMEIWVLAS